MENTTAYSNESTSATSGITSSTDITCYLYVELVYTGIVFALGCPGNLLIIVVQAKNARKTTTDYLVLCMAMYELVCSGFNVPVIVFRHWKILWGYIGSTFWCGLTVFLYSFTNLGSSQMLAAIAVDRCIKTCFPLCTIYTERVAKVVCAAVLALSVFLSAPWAIIFHWNPEEVKCSHTLPPVLVDGQDWGQVTTTYGGVLFFTIFFPYLIISITLRRRHAQKVKGRRHLLRSLKEIENQSSLQSKNIALRFDSQLDSSTPATNSSVVTGDVIFEPTGHVSETTNVCKSRVVDVSMVTPGFSGTDDLIFCDNDQQNGPETGKVFSLTNRERIDIRGHYMTEQSSGIQDKQNNTSEPMKNPRTGTTKSDSVSCKSLMMEGRNLNRLTVIMFTISLVYMSTYAVNWLLYFLGPATFGEGFLHISFSIPLINCTTNAVMFVAMSSRFRHNARKICCAR